MVQDNSAAWEPSRDSDNTFEMVQEINAGSPNIKVVGVGCGGSKFVATAWGSAVAGRVSR